MLILGVFGGTLADVLAAIGDAIDAATGGADRAVRPAPSVRCATPYHRAQCRRGRILPYSGAALTRGCELIQEAIRTWHCSRHRILKVLNALDRDEEGQGLAEYALILALIAIVAIVALIFLGGQVSKILSTVGNSV